MATTGRSVAEIERDMRSAGDRRDSTWLDRLEREHRKAVKQEKTEKPITQMSAQTLRHLTRKGWWTFTISYDANNADHLERIREIGAIVYPTDAEKAVHDGNQ